MFESGLRDKQHQMRVEVRRRQVAEKLRQHHQLVVDRNNQQRVLEYISRMPEEHRPTEEWFGQLSRLATEVGVELTFTEELLSRLDDAVRGSKSAQALEAYTKVIGLMCCQNAKTLARWGLANFAVDLIDNHLDISIKSHAIMMCAVLAAKSQYLAEIVLSSGAVQSALREAEQHHQELSVVETHLFSSTVKTLSAEQMESVFNFHLNMLQLRRGSMCDILNGLTELLRVSSRRLIDLACDQKLISMLLSMTSELQLTPQEMISAHRIIYIVTDCQEDYFSTERPETHALIDFLLYMLNTDNDELNKYRNMVYFHLSNIFLDGFKIAGMMLEKGLLRELAKSVIKESKDTLVEALITVRNLMNICKVEAVSQEFIESGLLDALLYHVELHLIQPESVLLLLVQIIHNLTSQSHTIRCIIDSRMVLKSLLHSESRRKLKRHWEELQYSLERVDE